MTVGILIATMFQVDYSLLDKMNVCSDAIVVNQCDKNSQQNLDYNGYKILWINSTERGLSRSRNMALRYSNHDICLLCDDDEIMCENYQDKILTAYNTMPVADIIIFNVARNDNRGGKVINKIKQLPWYKTYSSVHISFKVKSIKSKKIQFDNNFGTGSGKFLNAEDNIFLNDCKSNKLKIYMYPVCVASLTSSISSWFSGYNRQYFYDVGAYLARSYPYFKYVFMWYYLIRLHNLSEISYYEMIFYMIKGIDGYKTLLNCQEYFDEHGKTIKRKD